MAMDWNGRQGETVLKWTLATKTGTKPFFRFLLLQLCNVDRVAVTDFLNYEFFLLYI